MRFPIRYQFMLPLLVVAAVSLTAVAWINASLASRRASERIGTQLRGVAQVLTTSTFPLSSTVLRQMKNLSSADFVLVDRDGREIASTISTTISTTIPTDTVPMTLDEVALGSPLLLDNVRYFHSSVHLARRPGADQSMVLHIFFPYEEFRAAWRAAFFLPLWVGVITIAAVAIVTHLVARRISRATEQLGADVRRMAGGDFNVVALPTCEDEVRDLSLAVNQTATRLADYERQVRRTEQLRTVALLGAGLAHEMRNAATGCRLAVDLHAENCHDDPDGEGLAVARRQLDWMETRLQRFLQLGKQPAKLDLRSTRLGQLVDDLLPLIRPVARHAGVELRWQPPETDVEIRADAEVLGQSIINLILNAIEAVRRSNTAASDAGKILINVRHTSDSFAEFEICDSGAGPPKEIADQLFQPFSTGNAEGVGLGLAVAKQVVEAHGGTIVWDRDDGLTRFRISMPLSTEELAHV